MRLTHSIRPRTTTVQFVGPTPWCREVAMLMTLVSCCSELTLDYSWIEDVVTWFVDIDSVRNNNLYNSGLNICKGGRQILVYFRKIIYHRDRDGNDRLVSRDVRGWWVARGISRKATGITTGRGDLVPCWFDSQVYGSFLFHLVTW